MITIGLTILLFSLYVILKIKTMPYNMAILSGINTPECFWQQKWLVWIHQWHLDFMEPKTHYSQNTDFRHYAALITDVTLIMH